MTEKGDNIMSDKQTEAQHKAFNRAVIAGKARHVAELNGGTGELRRMLGEKEIDKKRSRRKMQKNSRKVNRKGGR